jgi:hypothetical protein
MLVMRTRHGGAEEGVGDVVLVHVPALDPLGVEERGRYKFLDDVARAEVDHQQARGAADDEAVVVTHHPRSTVLRC